MEIKNHRWTQINTDKHKYFNNYCSGNKFLRKYSTDIVYLDPVGVTHR